MCLSTLLQQYQSRVVLSNFCPLVVAWLRKQELSSENANLQAMSQKRTTQRELVTARNDLHTTLHMCLPLL